jgi:uncharacterized protein
MTRPRVLRAIRLIGIAAALYAAGSVVAGVVLGHVAVRPFRIALGRAAIENARAEVRPLGGQVSDVAIAARDGVTLHGWLFSPARPNGHGVVALHGVSDNRRAMRGLAALLLKAGYTILAPDARAQGASGGTLATYGILERDDIQRWIDLLRTRTTGCIHGFGSSMGASQLLQIVDRGNLLCSVIVESPFATLKEAVFDRVGRPFGMGHRLGPKLLRPIVETGFVVVRSQYGVDLMQADPLAHVPRSRVPILVIHGLADVNTPPRHARMIQAANPQLVTLWLVEHATHTAAWSAEPSQYPARVLAFFTAHEPPGRVGASVATSSQKLGARW